MARTRTRSTASATAKPKAEEPQAKTTADAAPEEPKVEEQPKERKPREVSDDTKALYERIRVMYEDQGLGFPSIANRLNAEGVKTLSTGVKWYAPVVRGIVMRNGWTKGDKKANETAPA